MATIYKGDTKILTLLLTVAITLCKTWMLCKKYAYYLANKFNCTFGAVFTDTSSQKWPKKYVPKRWAMF